jgi:choline kinase
MNAIHLAAGEGTRLRPLTDDRPKPLVELGETSLLERNVETLESVGLTEQLVVTGYEADEIRALGYDTVHNERYDETDMVYSLFRASERFRDDEDLVISYGDIIYESGVAEALLGCPAPLCVVVDREWRQLWEARFEDPLDDAETLRIDEDGYIQAIGGEPEDYDGIEGQYIGLLKVRSDHLDRFVAAYRSLGEDGDAVSIDMTAFIQQLIDDGWPVRAVPVDRGWLEVDTVEDLREYRDRLGSGTLEELGVSLAETDG